MRGLGFTGVLLIESRSKYTKSLVWIWICCWFWSLSWFHGLLHFYGGGVVTDVTSTTSFEWRVVLLVDLGCALGGQRERTDADAELWTILCITHRPAVARLWERRGSLEDSAGPRSPIALAWTLSSLFRESPEEPVKIELRYSILTRMWKV